MTSSIPDVDYPHGRGEHVAAQRGGDVEIRFIPTGVGNMNRTRLKQEAREIAAA